MQFPWMVWKLSYVTIQPVLICNCSQYTVYDSECTTSLIWAESWRNKGLKNVELSLCMIMRSLEIHMKSITQTSEVVFYGYTLIFTFSSKIEMYIFCWIYIYIYIYILHNETTQYLIKTLNFVNYLVIGGSS